MNDLLRLRTPPGEQLPPVADKLAIQELGQLIASIRRARIEAAQSSLRPQLIAVEEVVGMDPRD